MRSRKPKRKSGKGRASQNPKFTPPQVGSDFQKLVAVMSRLRSPDGCLWDREQTHSTLRTYLVEEAYEVLDALDSADDAKFAEELGDLLLQVLFHAQIAHEEGRFDISSVIHEIHDKMVRRHPHVFGTTIARTAADVLRNWEQIKSAERQAKSQTADSRRAAPSGRQLGVSDLEASSDPSAATAPAPRQKSAERASAGNATKQTQAPEGRHTPDQPVSILDGVPLSIPALLEALQLTRKAARIGFDWPDLDGIFAKLTEETNELRAVLAESNSKGHVKGKGPRGQSFSLSRTSGGSDNKAIGKERASAPEELSSSRIEDELGDILFVAVNLARFLNIDPEIALKKTSGKFSRRFRAMEHLARAQATTLAQIPRTQMESLWDQAKQLEQHEPISPSK
ncbi:MAG: nucleoside triphosphate pyrophosphohydrolase [Candidatus Acidiferrum sp.]